MGLIAIETDELCVCVCLGCHKELRPSFQTCIQCMILPCFKQGGVSCLVSFVVVSLCRIEFQNSSTFNTHPVPRAIVSAAVLIVMTEIPDRLCHILSFYLCCNSAVLNCSGDILARFDHLLDFITLVVHRS